MAATARYLNLSLYGTVHGTRYLGGVWSSDLREARQYVVAARRRELARRSVVRRRQTMPLLAIRRPYGRRVRCPLSLWAAAAFPRTYLRQGMRVTRVRTTVPRTVTPFLYGRPGWYEGDRVDRAFAAMRRRRA